MIYKLKCFSCGKSKEVTGPDKLQVGYQLAEMCESVHWLSVFDTKHDRVVAFCSHKCHEKQKTKSGTIRLYPKKV